MPKVHHIDVKRESKENFSFRNILKLPYYLLIVCGQTLSTDGTTISRRMVAYCGAIYVLNLVLLFRNITCFDKDDDFESSDVAENICSVIYHITLQIMISIQLYGSVKKFPLFIKKLKKLENSIKNDSLQIEIQSSMKRISIIGLVCSVILAIGLIIFDFVISTLSTFENCPKHKWLFGTQNQYQYAMQIINVMNIFPGFQCVTGLTYCVCLCNVVTIHFKYLRKQLEMNAESRMDKESEDHGLQGYRCSAEQIRRIRVLYEHTCELTAKLDDILCLLVGVQLLFEIPMICLFSYNAFVPEFRLDFLFYSLFAFSFCLVILAATANLNSQVISHQIITGVSSGYLYPSL